MIPNSFSIGSFTFHIYGLIIAIAIVIGWWLAIKRAHLYKIDPNPLYDPLIILPLILGVIGGRLYHVADFWSYYQNNPVQIINISGGGLGIFGALIGIFVGFWLFAQIKKTKLLPLLDLLSPSLILGQALGRIGNFINQEGFGPPTNLPWGVYIDPAHRPDQYLSFSRFHPTFFYEAILDMAAFLILIVILERSDRILKKFSLHSNSKKPGQTFGLYLILYGVIRFIVEFWRIDTARIGDLQIAHLISTGTFLAGVFLLKRKTLDK